MKKIIAFSLVFLTATNCFAKEAGQLGGLNFVDCEKHPEHCKDLRADFSYNESEQIFINKTSYPKFTVEDDKQWNQYIITLIPAEADKKS